MHGDEDWQDALSSSGQLSPQIVEAILLRHGDRGRKAIEAVGEHRVKQYNDFTVVVGWHDEYIVENEQCDCPDTQYNLDTEDPDQLCWHVLATIIAKELGELDEYDQWYGEIADLL
jgi:predicted nucleic acid-binding Zn finger protein